MDMRQIINNKSKQNLGKKTRLHSGLIQTFLEEKS